MFVLLDSNVWLSATLGGFCRRVVDEASEDWEFIVTPYIRTEVKEKLTRKFGYTIPNAERILEKLFEHALSRNDVDTVTPELRDPDDQPILAAAVAHGCRFLVTGDKDLLVLKQCSGVEIITVREFASRLGLDVD